MERLEMSSEGKTYDSVKQQYLTSSKGMQFTIKGVTENMGIEALENQTYTQTVLNTIFAQLIRYSQMNSKSGIIFLEKEQWQP